LHDNRNDWQDKLAISHVHMLKNTCSKMKQKYMYLLHPYPFKIGIKRCPDLQSNWCNTSRKNTFTRSYI